MKKKLINIFILTPHSNHNIGGIKYIIKYIIQTKK